MTFVVSDGQLQSISKPSAPRLPAGMQLSPALSLTYQEIWRRQPAVRTVVGFIARNLAQIGVKVVKQVADNDARPAPDHPLAVLLRAPMPGTKLTQYRLIDQLVHDVCIFDAAYLLKVKVDGTVGGLLPVPPSWVTPKGGRWWEAERFEIRGPGGQVLSVEAKNIVHLHGYNPDDRRVGTSPMETLRGILAEEFAAQSYREQLWRSGARTSGYIKRPPAAKGGVGKWSPADRERFRMMWRSQYTGEGGQAGGTPILEEGMEWVPAAMSPRDAQYVESRKLTREEVAAAFWLPQAMVGLLDHATFSNIADQHLQLYQDSLGPWTVQFEQDIVVQLLTDLDPVAAALGTVFPVFDFSAKLRGSFEQETAALVSATGAPWMSRNETRARQGLGRLDDPAYDEVITPLNVVVGGLANPLDAAPDEPDNRASNGQASRRLPGKASKRRGVRPELDVDAVAGPLVRFFERQGKAVLSRLGAEKARKDVPDLDAVWARARWDRELTADLAAAAKSATSTAAETLLAQLGYDPSAYDVERTVEWLSVHAAALAESINDATERDLVKALDPGEADEYDATAAVAALYASYAETRAPALAASEASAMSGFAAREAAQQLGFEERVTKTWRTGANPRAAHARLNGQTVGIGETFSNGARWPGDSRLSAEQRAGCNCALEYSDDAGDE